MSTEEPEKRRKRVTERTKAALLAVIEAARYVKKPNLQNIAIRCGVNYGTLKVTYYQWRKGDIDLGEPDTPLQIELDTNTEHRRTRDLILATEHFLNDMLAGTMVIVKEKTVEGNRDAFFDMKVPQIIAAQLQLAKLRDTKEKGYMAFIDSVHRMEKEQRAAREIEANVIDVPSSAAGKRNDDDLFEELRREVKEGQIVTQ